nr:methionyl aminopeptidase [Anaerosporobacter faecicola]
MKLGRNDLCWCGSNKKYKSCHLAFDEKITAFEEEGAIVPSRDMIKTPEQIEGVRKAGEVNTLILDKLEPYIKEGISTEEINDLVNQFTKELGGIPAPLNFEGYPKSVCVSINEVVCHGIPCKERKLMSGDIVNIDVSTIVNGYFGDSSRMYCIGEVSEEKRKLVQVTKECVDLAMKEIKPWSFLGDVGYVINQHAKANGYTVVREIGGHGVGLEFHEEPWVSHIGQRGTDMLLVPGMIFTVEPMVNMGKADVVQDEEDGWTIYTEDGKPSAQWEYMILVTEDGMEILAH